MSIKGFNISGTTYKVDYPELDNLPQINGNDLVGNMSGESLGLREVAGVFYPGGTNAQIETLLDSGVKVVFVDVPVNGLLNPRTRCPLIKRVSATEHHFATTTQNACVYAICKDNNWSHTVEAYARPSQFPDAALTLPEPLGTAAIGTSMDYARANHVHAMPAAEDVGAIPDPTTKSSGQVLTYNGYSWVASTPTGGGGGGAVDSVNGQTGSVVLAASDVGAIPAPASASAGQFLVYDGSTWTAQTLATWQGGSY